MPGRSSLRPYLARTGIEVIICTAAVHGCAELRRLSSVAQAVVKQPRVQAEQWAPTATACTCRRSRQTPLMYWGHQAEVETCEHGSGICGPPSDLLRYAEDERTDPQQRPQHVLVPALLAALNSTLQAGVVPEGLQLSLVTPCISECLS